MPRATITSTTERLELKTCPGGWVDLKRLTYGQYLHRSEIVTKMKVQGTDKKNRQKDSEKIAGILEMANKRVTEYEFSNCIMDHNLTDDNDNPLNFSNPLTLEALDPRIGNEIADKINEMHEFMTEDEEGN